MCRASVGNQGPAFAPALGDRRTRLVSTESTARRVAPSECGPLECRSRRLRLLQVPPPDRGSCPIPRPGPDGSAFFQREREFDAFALCPSGRRPRKGTRAAYQVWMSVTEDRKIPSDPAGRLVDKKSALLYRSKKSAASACRIHTERKCRPACFPSGLYRRQPQLSDA